MNETTTDENRHAVGGSALQAVVGLRRGQEVVISPDRAALDAATQDERNGAIVDLFCGLTDAIRKHGCHVDLDDPNSIRVSKD